MSFTLHPVSVWDEGSTSQNGSVNVCSSLPLTPPKIFPNCLDITFHTSKQEAVFPTFKNRPSANPWGCCLINSTRTGPTTHPASRWAPEWKAVTRAPALPGPTSWSAAPRQAGQGTWLDSTFLSVEWDDPSTIYLLKAFHSLREHVGKREGRALFRSMVIRRDNSNKRV